MARIGYTRVSSIDQDLHNQLEKLKAENWSIVRSKKISGATQEGRKELAVNLDFLRDGNELVVIRIRPPWTRHERRSQFDSRMRTARCFHHRS